MTQDHSATVRPVILCGGAGTRLWPVSRKSFPKQLLAVAGDQSLLQQTAGRLSGELFAPPILVSGEDQGPFIKQQLEEVEAPVEAILLEPVGRNTAAAAALAAEWLNDKDEILLLMPSDHVIGDRDAFVRAIKAGLPHARDGSIVTFGATPSGPNTQYGYIEADAERPLSGGAFAIARFHEKPDSAKAADYVASGRFYWNAGIFLAKAGTILDEMKTFLPQSLDAISDAVTEGHREGLFIRPAARAFEQVQNISIDYGIMEETSRGVVVPVRMDWSDVGSWDAVWKLGQKDAANNVKKGEVAALNSRDCLLRSEGGVLVAALGLEKMAVIATGDAVLVAPLDRMDELKALVEQVKGNNPDRV